VASTSGASRSRSLTASRNRFGTRRTFLVAVCLFTGASALCGVAGSVTQLVIFRLIQGAGGGLMVPVSPAVLFRTFPPELRARAAGMVALGTTLGPATGPLLGGILVTELSWRWCFYVNVPLCVGIPVTGLLFLAEHREPAAGRLDVAGFLLTGSGLALFLYAISEGSVAGWSSPVVLGTGEAGRLAGPRRPVQPGRLSTSRAAIALTSWAWSRSF
jgi:MFS family permease